MSLSLEYSNVHHVMAILKIFAKQLLKSINTVLCYHLNKSNQFLHQDIEVGPTTGLSQYTEFHEYICGKIMVSMEEKIKWIKYESLSLKKHVCVFMGVGNLYPKFCKVIDLI